ncbi:hypothetical protein [Blastococcus brunescens]|uniref:Uncharacterized protein n=1 Tax=Blastococcus brunescens TaxID=1564165 RepID=A0ABZ1AYK5_9ACTN|nr:hypothetical protein [Blastococcus sp. BMG 8361]WRL61885.1 hypothetical protein U6N30_17405 [Blastococcus sp. BMG 8361]
MWGRCSSSAPERRSPPRTAAARCASCCSRRRRGHLVLVAGGASRLRSSRETLAASAAGLALSGADLGGPLLGGHPGSAAALTAGFLVLHRAAPTTITWPLVAWGAAQLAVLRALDAVAPALHTGLFLAVALVGLGIALFGRRIVARVALVTAAPWWLAGVVGGTSSAWGDAGLERWLSAGMMIAAAAGLLLARLRAEVEPLMGPRWPCRSSRGSWPERPSPGRSPRWAPSP